MSLDDLLSAYETVDSIRLNTATPRPQTPWNALAGTPSRGSIDARLFDSTFPYFGLPGTPLLQNLPVHAHRAVSTPIATPTPVAAPTPEETSTPEAEHVPEAAFTPEAPNTPRATFTPHATITPKATPVLETREDPFWQDLVASTCDARLVSDFESVPLDCQFETAELPQPSDSTGVGLCDDAAFEHMIRSILSAGSLCPQPAWSQRSTTRASSFDSPSSIVPPLVPTGDLGNPGDTTMLDVTDTTYQGASQSPDSASPIPNVQDHEYYPSSVQNWHNPPDGNASNVPSMQSFNDFYSANQDGHQSSAYASAILNIQRMNEFYSSQGWHELSVSEFAIRNMQGFFNDGPSSGPECHQPSSDEHDIHNMQRFIDSYSSSQSFPELSGDVSAMPNIQGLGDYYSSNQDNHQPSGDASAVVNAQNSNDDYTSDQVHPQPSEDALATRNIQNVDVQHFEIQNITIQDFDSQNFNAHNLNSQRFNVQNIDFHNLNPQNFNSQDFNSQDSVTDPQNFNSQDPSEFDHPHGPPVHEPAAHEAHTTDRSPSPAGPVSQHPTPPTPAPFSQPPTPLTPVPSTTPTPVIDIPAEPAPSDSNASTLTTPPLPLPSPSPSPPPPPILSSVYRDDVESVLRREFNIPQDTEVDLRALADPPADKPPPYPYRTLVCLAIWGSPLKRLQLQGIWQALIDRFDWYRRYPKDRVWRVRFFAVFFVYTQSDSPVTIMLVYADVKLELELASRRHRQENIRNVLVKTYWFVAVEEDGTPVVGTRRKVWWQIDVSAGKGVKKSQKEREKAVERTRAKRAAARAALDASTPAPTPTPAPAAIPIKSDREVETILRWELRVLAPKRLDLWALDDPPPGQAPSHPYKTLNCLAIWGSPKKRLMIREIWQVLMDRFEWYRTHPEEKGWKDNVRNTLTKLKIFVPTKEDGTPFAGRGGTKWWRIDVTAGPGRTRPDPRWPKKRAAVDKAPTRQGSMIASETGDGSQEQLDEARGNSPVNISEPVDASRGTLVSNLVPPLDDDELEASGAEEEDAMSVTS
ncbi:hypothetical protein CONPUDRAFT_163057 [Coniophora puteana RWD-64-598 SS2]|uniref:Fork-head domain-containing protein n=1 Tax=Coniophora puteana (strain RWD-64-598) TaxID=741705 RepID=A0A5M3MX76_CONPW|nr:uncharacterized protein CONPUDRAFT_163057 [Coniophora puteana RWD-64-598 SS2]EIW83753.1 hypothetical protein CONPUDRAFT_163057 [Coniophora puteana RWD-64-598 SS2]